MKAQITYEGRELKFMPDLFQDDVEQQLTFTIKSEDGNIVDLTGDVVLFKMRQINTTSLKVDTVCVLDNPSIGLCSYESSSGDLDTIGVFDAELQVTQGTQVTTIRLGKFQILADLP